ncbi:MAG: Protein kinase domain [Gemmatimonadetes bacterium]|nr:Protein kinase domain [Gemmatimonadota bacterium]
MSDTTHPYDLSALDEAYEIVGTVDLPDGTRGYIANRKGDTAKRRDDQTGVLIAVVTTPAGDEANALLHLASDTQTLARLPHRRLVPVLEGRWLGPDAYAVVSQRINDPTLAHMLETGEEFSNPRIAAILREVNGLLEWAREQKIVHRNISADRIFLEPKTDRVRVTFGVAPIRRIHAPDAADDARAIARLGLAMLTGTLDPTEYEEKSLAELRPDLPGRLAEATAALLDEKKPATPADVAAYLAMIGMADPIFEGETERERIRAEILEEQRVDREKAAAERAALEKEIADARAAFEAEMLATRAKHEFEIAALKDALATERADLERAVAAERAEMERATAAERSELERAVTAERTELKRALTEERQALVARRAELERAVAEQKAELERVAAEDRKRIAELRAEIERVGELEVERKRQAALEELGDVEVPLDEGELETPVFMPAMISPLDQLTFDDDSPVMSEKEVVFETTREEKPAFVAPVGAVGVNVPNRSMRKRYLVAAAIVGVLAIGATSAVVIGGRRPAQVVAKPAPKAVVAPKAAVVLPTPAPAAPSTPALVVDSAALRVATRWLDSLKDAHPVIVARPKPVVRDSTPRRDAASVSRPARRDSGSVGESLTIPGGVTPVRRDTSARRDTTVKRDTTVRPDTTAR